MCNLCTHTCNRKGLVGCWFFDFNKERHLASSNKKKIFSRYVLKHKATNVQMSRFIENIVLYS